VNEGEKRKEQEEKYEREVGSRREKKHRE